MANDISGFGSVNQTIYDAILAMDSYHRGYGQGVLALEDYTQVGRYTFTTDSLNLFSGYRLTDAQFAGFYAATYVGSGGDEIIAYRGTDDAADVPFGWSVGAGYSSIGSVDLIKACLAWADEQETFPISDVTKDTLDDFVEELQDTSALVAEIYAAVQSSTDAASAATAVSQMVYERINADAVAEAVEDAYEDYRDDLKESFREKLTQVVAALEFGYPKDGIQEGVDAFLESQTMQDIFDLIDYKIKQAIKDAITKPPISDQIEDMATSVRDSLQSALQSAFEAGGEDFDRGAAALRQWTQSVAASNAGLLAADIAKIVDDSEDFLDLVGKVLTENEYFKGSVFDRQFSHAALAKEYFELSGEDDKTVGHSLGGGLAAFVAALKGNTATGFDAMPAYLAAAHDLGIDTEFSILAALAFPDVFEEPANDILTQLNLASYEGYHVEGEILEAVRSGDAATMFAVFFGLATAALSWFGKLGPAKWSAGFFDQAFKLAVWTDALENLNPSTPIDPHASDGIVGDLIGSVNFHSIAYLIILKYAETLDHQDWQVYAQQIKDALFDEELALDAGWGASRHTAPGRHLDTMQKAIAYSAIEGASDEGLVFGNTAIRALFDDANELGYAHENDAMPHNIKGTEETILKAVMQFAAQMARQKVDYNAVEGDVGPEEGILLWMDENGIQVDPTEAVVMELDLSPALWGLVGEGGEAPITDIPEVPVLWEYLAHKWTVKTETAEAMMSELYGGAKIENVVKWTWSSDDIALDLDLPTRTDDKSEYDIELQHFFSATEKDDNVRMGWDNDIVLAGLGDDTIWAGFGADIISLQGGNDWVIDQISEIDETNVGDIARRDIYLGAGFNIDYDDFFVADLLYDLVNFLFDVNEDDHLKYTLQATDDAGTLVGNGVIVQELEEMRLGTLPFVRIKLITKEADGTSEDFLNGIDVVHLTEKKDEIYIDTQMKDVPIWIDMADPGAENQTFSKADWDYASYKDAGEVVVINGSTRTNIFGNPEIAGVKGSLGLLISLIFEVPPHAQAVLNQWSKNDGLRVSGVEKIQFGDGEDLYWSADLGDIAGWINGRDFQRFGEVWLGKGDDIAYMEDAEYVFAGEYIGNEEDLDSPMGHGGIAGEDMWLEIHGEEGNDVLISRNGEGARLYGGPGRDFLFSTAYKAQLFGGEVDANDGETDVFWFHPGVFIMDAEKDDILQMYGVPLTGGSNSLFGFEAYSSQWAWDMLLPFVFYARTASNQLVVTSLIHDITGWNEEFPEIPSPLHMSMIVENFEWGEYKDDYLGTYEKSDLNMYFRIVGGSVEISVFRSAWGQIKYFIDKLWSLAKGLNWQPAEDPLVLDLEGDGIETVSIWQNSAYFDWDGDQFAQKTAWLSRDDGFLVIDAYGDGRIETVDELFGNAEQTGFEELATYDDNHDGVIDANDAVWDELQVWRDLDGDGASTHAELFTMAMLGITSFDLGGNAMAAETPQGNLLRERGTFTYADGRVHDTFEVIFDADLSHTVFDGDRGVADFAPLGTDGTVIDNTGRGVLANLAVNASNDLAVREAILTAAPQMTVPDLATLKALVEPILGAWARSLEQSRELTPILTAMVDGVVEIVDSAKWVEDATGGHFVLASGGPLLDAGGQPVDAPDLADFAAAGWRIEQMFSPSDRAAELTERLERPYLVELVNDRAVVRDWGVWVADGAGGYWTLQSGNPVLDAGGAVIERPTLLDVRSQVTEGGAFQWRIETFLHDPFQTAPTDRIGVYLIDGEVVDYTVWVEDEDGGFHMWARNLDRALELQFKEGRPGGFGLRGYEVDLDTLDEANSTLDSKYRAEVLTIDEFRFALGSFGDVFEPEILSTRVDPDTGLLVYTSGGDAPEAAPADEYVSVIEPAIEFFGILMESYIHLSRAFAIRVASQTGLSQFFEGLDYDAGADKWVPTSGRELVPMFEQILTAMPADPGEAYDWLTGWNEMLLRVYPDYQSQADDAVDTELLFQTVVAAWENTRPAFGLLETAERLSVDEDRVVIYDPAEAVIEGTSDDEIFYVTGTGHTIRGNWGGDTYVVGRDFDDIIIEDVEGPLDPRSADFLRFSHLTPEDIIATKDGIDLVITVNDTGQTLTVKRQFDGIFTGIFGRDWSDDTEMVKIIFADGTAWTKHELAIATSHPKDTDDLVLGTPTIDVLEGGLGNDIMRGGRDSDTYVIRKGDGIDVIEDDNDALLVTHYDVLHMTGGITDETVRFVRYGDSDDLEIRMLDEAGVETGQMVTIVNQFKAINTWILGLYWQDRIERFVFNGGAFFDEGQIMARVLEDAKTDGADIIYGFHNKDTLDGGEGDDVLSGGDQDDVYRWGEGGGFDVIEDNQKDFLSQTFDTLVITGYGVADFTFEREGNSGTVTLASIANPDDKIQLLNEFVLTPTVILGDFHTDSVDLIRFGDGAEWDMMRLAKQFLDQARTDGDDTIYGFDLNDTLDGGAGDDRLEGGVYNDTYIWTRGYGNDTIWDQTHHALLRPGFDTVELRGIALNDVTFSRSGTDLMLTIKDTGEVLTLEGQYNRSGPNGQPNAVERFVFADRTVPLTDLNPEDIDLVGTDAAEELHGTDFAETIDSRAGDDTIYGGSDGDTYLFDTGYGHDVIHDEVTGRWTGSDTVVFGAGITTATVSFTRIGDDLLITVQDRPADSLRIVNQFGDTRFGVEQFRFFDGTLWSIADVEAQFAISGGNRGDNTIVGLEDQPNVLDGRQGDDQMFGGREGDTYAFGLDYDLDQITEWADVQATGGAVDRVVFGYGVTLEALLITRDGDDLIFTLPDSGDQLRIVEGLGARQVEEFLFADGTTLTLEDIRSRMIQGTEGNDLLEGFDDRQDDFGASAGDDLLAGGGEDDTYHFGLGSGADAIDETSGFDVVEIAAPLTAESVTFHADGDTLVIRVPGTDDSLAILGGLGATGKRIEEFRFEAGQVLTHTQVVQLLVDRQAGLGDDIVEGYANSAEQLTGSTGHDRLTGFSGGDTYIYHAGDGFDIIDDRGGTIGDELRIEDYPSAAAIVRRVTPDSLDVLLDFGNGDEIIIVDGLRSGGGGTIERIVLADGVVWTFAELRAKVLADLSVDTETLAAMRTGAGDGVFFEDDGVVITSAEAEAIGAGNQRIIGFDGNDSAAGGIGDDEQDLKLGSDTYTFRRGDGRDLISDTGGALDTDTLLIEGYEPGEVRVTRPYADRDDLLLIFDGTDDEILLRGQFSPTAGKGIETVVFGDGTVWSRAEIAAAITSVGTDGEDLITGSTGAEVLDGLRGDDTLIGGSGADTYVWRAGDGHDLIVETSNQTDTLRLIGVRPEDVVVRRALGEPDSLVLDFPAPGDRITVRGGLGSAGVERFEFDDGTVWTLDEVKAQILSDTATDGDDLIVGFAAAETIAGGAGDDTMRGGDGSDTYIVGPGTGRDVVQDIGSADTDRIDVQGYGIDEVVFRIDPLDTATLFIGLPDGSGVRIIGGLEDGFGDGIEQYAFADGTVLTAAQLRARIIDAREAEAANPLNGFATPDSIEATADGQTLSGRGGSDTYIVRSDVGFVTIEDNGSFVTDTLSLPDLTSAEVTFHRLLSMPDDLIISFGPWDGTGAHPAFGVRIIGGAKDGTTDTVEVLAFGDGSTMNIAAVRALIVAGGATAGDDRITGFIAADTIEGGLGEDRLSGLDGQDLYIHRAGDGVSIINDNGSFETDTLRIIGFDPADVRFEKDPLNDNWLRISFAGSSDRIEVRNTLTNGGAGGVERFEILSVDGQPADLVLTKAQLAQLLLDQAVTAGNDRIIGNNFADTLTGGAGDDLLSGRDTSDSYIYVVGTDGDDTIADQGGFETDTVKLIGIDPANVTVARSWADPADYVLTFAG